MLLTRFVKVKINNHSMPHYKSLGYNVRMFDEIVVPVEDLTPKSTAKIYIKCDYCGAEYTTTYSCYTRNVALDESLGRQKTDACVHCRHLKAKDTYQYRYGVGNPMQLESIKNKAQETNIQKYGFRNPILNKDIDSKRVNTLIEKYGQTNPMKVNEFAQKQRESMQNGNGLCSHCQKYLAKLYNGAINYRFGKYLLDIYIESKNIDVEVNGSGHNLDVILGKMTQEDFEAKEDKRINVLSSNGIKQIIFILENDKLPNDDILNSIMSFAENKFNEGYSVIYFYCDKKYIMLDNKKIKYNYRDLI